MESFQVVLVPKGGAAPSNGQASTANRAYVQPQAKVRAHIQKTGTVTTAHVSKTATITLGTTGKSRRLEAFSLAFDQQGVSYQAHVAKIGWQAAKSNGALAGTTGRKLGVQAVRFNLSGTLAESHDIWYRVHAQKIGWMGWAKNGESAGTVGCGLNAEAVQVRLVPKGAAAPGSTKVALLDGADLGVSLNVGALTAGSSTWKDVSAGKTAGTTGKKKPLVGMRMTLTSTKGLEGSLQYRAHVSKKGWLGWSKNGAASKSGSNKIEALQIRLTGELARHCDVYYRCHVSGHGWMGWAKNGASAGSTGLGKGVEAYQVRIVPKGGKAPGSTARSFSDKNGFLAAYQGVAKLAGVVGSMPSGLATKNTSFSMSSAAGQRLQRAIRNVESGGKSVGFVMIDLRSGKAVSYNANRDYYCASSIKGPYVAAINKFVPGAVNGPVRSTMHSTITVSSNEGYAALRSRFGSYPMAALQKQVGGCSFPATRNYCYMKPKDLAKLWVGCYDYFYVNTNANSAWARSLYSDPLLSFIHGSLAGRSATLSKPGWIAESSYYLARNDAGIVMANGHPYVVAVMSTAYGKDAQLSELVRALDGVHAAMLA